MSGKPLRTNQHLCEISQVSVVELIQWFSITQQWWEVLVTFQSGDRFLRAAIYMQIIHYFTVSFKTQSILRALNTSTYVPTYMCSSNNVFLGKNLIYFKSLALNLTKPHASPTHLRLWGKKIMNKVKCKRIKHHITPGLYTFLFYMHAFITSP